MKILIIEDDKILSDTIKQCVNKEFDVEQAYDGEEGILFAKQNIYDIIILDLMIPIYSGYEVLNSLRKEKITTPVLILTAKDSLEDKVKGLRNGADDYLIKPFEKEELLARLEAIIRRSNKSYENNTIVFKEIIYDRNNRNITILGEKLDLQGKQYDMLEYLMIYKNTILTKEQIFDKIWGFDSETTANVIEVYASGIRKELKKFKYDSYLKTIRGVGYMLSE